MSINTKDNSEKCPKCGGSRTTGKAGTITQWIAGCTCAVADEGESAQEIIQICGGCGKRINPGRSGSFTQWIFRLDLCTCENPQPTGQIIESLTDSQSMEPMIFDTDEEEIEVDPHKFPTERYKPTAILGKGASGAVYSCWDKLLNKKIALKTLNILDQNQIVKFQSEAKATSMLSHPNIVQVLDFGVSEANVPYMAMEFIDGRSLLEHIESEGPLTLESAVNIFTDVLNGLSHAHSKGVLHRDIKSSNLLVNKIDSENPVVKVIDFGVAIVEKGEDSKGNKMVGSPAYMPPDSALGIEYNDRSEIYGLGCTLFEALTGRPPFISQTALETIRKHAEEIPPLISEVAPEKDFPEELVALVDKCLSKNPDERYQSMAQLKDEIEKLRPEEIVEYVPERPRTIEWTQLKSLSNIPPSAVLAVFVLAAGIGIIVTFLAMKKGEKTQHLAVEQDLPLSNITSVIETVVQPHFSKYKLDSGKMLYRTREDFKDSDLAQLKGDTEVEELGLFSNGITDKGINKYIKGLKLRSLYLTSNKITDESVDTICGIEGLKILDISHTAITDKGLEKITKNTGLSFLAFGNGNSDNNTLKIASNLSTLDSIKVCAISKADFTGYNYLSRLPDLKKLELSGCTIPTNTIKFLKNMRISSLTITKTALTIPDTKIISRLPLEYLEVARQRMTPAKIKQLSEMKQLKSLNFTSCDLSDQHARYLAGMTKLKHLQINFNNITNESLKYIESMKSLKTLDLTGCYNLNEREVAKLSIKLPKCKVKKFTDREKDNKAFAEVTNSLLESNYQIREYRKKQLRPN